MCCVTTEALMSNYFHQSFSVRKRPRERGEQEHRQNADFDAEVDQCVDHNLPH